MVRSIHVAGGVHFDDRRLDLAGGLNGIIAGRGAGKASVRHPARDALDVAAPTTEQARVRCVAQVAATLGPGVTTVHVRTAHGATYARSRVGDPARVVGEGRELVGEGRELVGVSLAGALFVGTGRVLAWLRQRLLAGKRCDAPDTLAADTAALTPDDLEALARRAYEKEAFVIIVGDAKTLRPALESLQLGAIDEQ